RQVDRHALARDLQAYGVDDEIAAPQDIAPRDRRVGAPQHRPHARYELAWAERLGHVVVRAELEAGQPVRLLDSRGEHDDRHVALTPQRPGDLEAVHARQPEVEDDEVGPLGTGECQRVRAVTGG